MADTLDSIVKGTASLPAENAAKSIASTSGVTPEATPESTITTDTLPAASNATGKTVDATSHAPSTPSMIYLNLLVLEASLRAQYIELRARRRHHTFFLALLTLWVAGFGYALFFAPREDGRGMGGSVYWMVEVTEKLCFLGGLITGGLVWATGIWERGIRWPRRWLGTSNRGLRGFNCKLVVIRRPWWAEALSATVFFLTYGIFSETAGSSYRYVDPEILGAVDKELNLTRQGHQTMPVVMEDEEKSRIGHEEDLAPAGDHVKLLLLAKPFSATFRENWEIYRAEYWERENERRALIRAKLKQHDALVAKEAKSRAGWSWWAEKTKIPAPQPHQAYHRHQHSSSSSTSHSQVYEKGHHQRLSVIDKDGNKVSRGNSVRRSSTSGRSTRTPTPTLEGQEGVGGVSRTASSASDKRRKRLSTADGKMGKRPGLDSRSVTPEIPSGLSRGSVSGGSPGRRRSALLSNS